MLAASVLSKMRAEHAHGPQPELLRIEAASAGNEYARTADYIQERGMDHIQAVANSGSTPTSRNSSSSALSSRLASTRASCASGSWK